MARKHICPNCGTDTTDNYYDEQGEFVGIPGWARPPFPKARWREHPGLAAMRLKVLRDLQR